MRAGTRRLFPAANTKAARKCVHRFCIYRFCGSAGRVRRRQYEGRRHPIGCSMRLSRARGLDSGPNRRSVGPLYLKARAFFCATDANAGLVSGRGRARVKTDPISRIAVCRTLRKRRRLERAAFFLSASVMRTTPSVITSLWAPRWPGGSTANERGRTPTPERERLCLKRASEERGISPS
jgi:hypothetical protein